MTDFLSSSANAALNHDCMSSNLTEWLLQEIFFFYSVAIASQKSHNPHTRADATLSSLKSDLVFSISKFKRFTISPIIFIQPGQQHVCMAR